jgi:hypothetical protein
MKAINTAARTATLLVLVTVAVTSAEQLRNEPEQRTARSSRSNHVCTDVADSDNVSRNPALGSSHNARAHLYRWISSDDSPRPSTMPRFEASQFDIQTMPRIRDYSRKEFPSATGARVNRFF